MVCHLGARIWRRSRRIALTLLEPFRGKVPDEVFGEPFVPPVCDGSEYDKLGPRGIGCRAAMLAFRAQSAAGCVPVLHFGQIEGGGDMKRQDLEELFYGKRDYEWPAPGLDDTRLS